MHIGPEKIPVSRQLDCTCLNHKPSSRPPLFSAIFALTFSAAQLHHPQDSTKLYCLLAPTYLTTDIHLVSEYGRRPLRSSTDKTLTVPRTHNRFGDRSFAIAGPRLWNSLPISLRQISSYGQFRRYLKNHLFRIWEITAQCDAWFSALYKYSYLLTYLLTCVNTEQLAQRWYMKWNELRSKPWPL